MSEAESGIEAGNSSVVQFRARAAVRTSEPYLSDEERQATRRLIALEDRIKLALKKLEHLELACPTAKRELRALLLHDE